MKFFERIVKLHRLLRHSRYPVSWQRILEELDCSTSTARRVMKELRESLRAPIEVTEDPVGYRYSDNSYELPGMLFTALELQVMLMIQQLLQSFEPGLLGNLLSPLNRLLKGVLKLQGLDSENAHRIRLLRVASRPAGPYFEVIASTLLKRRRLTIDYRAPGAKRATTREVSPQRLLHYRDKWYLDGWCHKQDGLRTFALHRIKNASALDVRATDIDEESLNAVLGSSYGIYSGAPTATAKLLFTPECAEWIDGEEWHPAQKGTRLKSGAYLLEIPYSSPKELVLDILRYGPDVEVLEPMELRESVADLLRKAAERYPQVGKVGKASKVAPALKVSKKSKVVKESKAAKVAGAAQSSKRKSMVPAKRSRGRRAAA